MYFQAKICLAAAFAMILSVTNLDAVDAVLSYEFLEGTYVVIGKRPDGDVTYVGRVRLIKSNDTLMVHRSISGFDATGVGRLADSATGKQSVLRVNFQHEGNHYDATYLIESDLDNHARLTGYVYLTNGNTKRVGWETLFADHGQLQRE